MIVRAQAAEIPARRGHDGEAGVAKALELRPGLILMDIQLPKISGLEAIRRLRAEAATATPIIAITSVRAFRR